VPFSGASLVAVAAFFALAGFLFLNTLYLQNVRGYSALHAGLMLLPTAAAMIVLAPLSGRLITRNGTRTPLLLGGGFLVAAPVMLTFIGPHTSPVYLLVAYGLLGAGVGIVNPPITNTAISGMPPAQAGTAAAIASTSRQVGSTLGVAVLGAVSGVGAERSVGPGFAEATHSSWWTVAALGALVFAAGLITTTPWARRTATGTAQRLNPDGA
jgi:MFS family permease